MPDDHDTWADYQEAELRTALDDAQAENVRAIAVISGLVRAFSDGIRFGAWAVTNDRVITLRQARNFLREVSDE